MLMPNESVVARALHRYRVHEARMLQDPADDEIRERFMDAAYTLCVLMGQRTALEAVRLAERCMAAARNRRQRPSARTRSSRAGARR